MKDLFIETRNTYFLDVNNVEKIYNYLTNLQDINDAQKRAICDLKEKQEMLKNKIELMESELDCYCHGGDV